MRSFPHLASLIVLTRDGVVRTQSSGHVRATRTAMRLRYKTHPSDLAVVRTGIHAAAQLHFAAGARSVMTLHTPMLRMDNTAAALENLMRSSVAPNRVGLFSAHVNGTARMGGNRSAAACSPAGELYGHRGVFVADGSLFPTAPGVNPQASIMAMASIISESLTPSAELRL